MEKEIAVHNKSTNREGILIIVPNILPNLRKIGSNTVIASVSYKSSQKRIELRMKLIA